MRNYTRRALLKLGSVIAGGIVGRRSWVRWAIDDAAIGAPSADDVALAQAEAFTATEILTRPTDRSVTLSVVPAIDLEAYVESGAAPGAYGQRTPTVSLPGGEAATIPIVGLVPNSRTFYRLRYRAAGASEFAAGPERRFHTQRAPGSSFVFAVQADSHLGTARHCDPELYARTLGNVARDEPDLFIDLGDTFRATKLKTWTAQTIAKLYLDQRPFLGLAAHSAPLFLVNGNHELEWGWLHDGTADSVPAMCARQRKALYPQPAPDGFYSADDEALPAIGFAQDYYAWQWGDALFIVIDPYWHTTTDPGGAGNDKVTGDDGPKDPWAWTLGERQYRWFKHVLETNTAAFTFVFHHHVLGNCRGGVEWADFYEWGGRERNGADTFHTHRPGWERPIHGLMVEHGVTIFFQGHDHLFARQERDGVVYQTVPMAGDPTYSTYNQDAFRSGDLLPNTGHLRVAVSPERVTVDYVRAFLAADEVDGHVNGEVAFSYTLPGAGSAPTPAAATSPAPSPTAPSPPTAAPSGTPSPSPLPTGPRGSEPTTVYLPYLADGPS